MSETENRPPRFPLMRLLLVNHGETEDDSFFPDFTGHGDPALSALGRRQAEALADVVNEWGPPASVAVYTSPLAGAQATASIIADALGLEVTVSNSLATILPESSLPEGEDGRSVLEALQERAWSASQALIEQHGPEATIVLVTHGLPIRALICRALEIPLTDTARFRVDPASVSALEFRGPRTMLACLNDVCHLDQVAG